MRRRCGNGRGGRGRAGGRADRLPDLTIYTRPLVLDQAQLAALAAVPDVRGVEPRSSFGGRVYVGARRAFAQVLGIPDFTRQAVNVVHVASGAASGTGAVLTDVQNARQGQLDVQAGQAVRIIAADGAVRSLQVRAAGDWPGKSSFQNASKFLYVITPLALLSALVLISNTVSTLVAEQTSEIGIMKAVGGRRIAAVYLKTALLLGGLGTVAGVVLGIVLAYVLTDYFGSTFYAVGVGFGIDWAIVLISALVGLAGPPLASPPRSAAPAAALAGTVLLALLITLVPIRRATHLRPGTALRYA